MKKLLPIIICLFCNISANLAANILSTYPLIKISGGMPGICAGEINNDYIFLLDTEHICWNGWLPELAEPVDTSRNTNTINNLFPKDEVSVESCYGNILRHPETTAATTLYRPDLIRDSLVLPQPIFSFSVGCWVSYQLSAKIPIDAELSKSYLQAPGVNLTIIGLLPVLLPTNSLSILYNLLQSPLVFYGKDEYDVEKEDLFESLLKSLVILSLIVGIILRIVRIFRSFR